MSTTVTITLTAPDDLADPSDPTGLTHDGYEALVRALADLGFESLVLVGPLSARSEA
jgi:hypothetical protein